MPAQTRQAFLASLSEEEARALCYDWAFWARAEQLAPAGEWWAAYTAWCERRKREDDAERAREEQRAEATQGLDRDEVAAADRRVLG